MRVHSSNIYAAFPEIAVDAEVQSATWAGSEWGSCQVVGVDTAEWNAFEGALLNRDSEVQWTYTNGGTLPVVVSQRLAEEVGLSGELEGVSRVRFNRSMRATSSDSTLSLTLKVVAVAPLRETEILAPVAAVRMVRGWQDGSVEYDVASGRFVSDSLLSYRADRYLHCEVYAQAPESVGELYERIRQRFDNEMLVSTNLSMLRQYQHYKRIAIYLFLFIMVLTLLGTVNSIACTFWAEALRRTRDIAVMRVLGASRTLVFLLYVIPAQAIGITASLFGWGLSLLTLRCIRIPAVSDRIRETIGINLAPLLDLPWWGLLATLGVSALFCFIGSAFPAWRASRQTVAVPLRQVA